MSRFRHRLAGSNRTAATAPTLLRLREVVRRFASPEAPEIAAWLPLKGSPVKGHTTTRVPSVVSVDLTVPKNAFRRPLAREASVVRDQN